MSNDETARNSASSAQYLVTNGATAQNINVTDLICEGPIKGLVDGAGSLYLDDVPVEDSKFSDFTPESFVNGSITFSGSATGTVSSNIDISSLEYNENSPRSIKLLYKQTTATFVSDVTNSDNTTRTITLDAASGNPFDSSWETGSQLSGNAEVKVSVSHPDTEPENGVFRVTDSNTVRLLTNASSREFPTSGSYTISVYYYIPIIAINAANRQITLAAAPTSGSYEFSVGTQLQIDDSGEAPASSSSIVKKIDNLNIDFRRGDLQQPITSSIGGVGGSVAVVGNTNLVNLPELKIISQSVSTSEGIGIFDKEGLPNSDGSNEYPGSPDYSVMADGATVLPSSSFGLDTAVKVAEADEIGFTIKYPAFQIINLEKGDKETAYAFYVMQIRFQQDNAYTDWKALFPGRGDYVKHFANTNAPVSFDHSVNLDGYRNIVGPFDNFQVRILRVSRHIGLPVRQTGTNEDDTKKKKWQLSATASIESLRAVIKDNFIYPYSSIASVSFSSRQFSSIPKRSYLLQGKLVKIPTTYTPREYSNTGIAKYDGFWDGTFYNAPVYTDNPAWVFYDIVTNNRYGAGKWVTDNEIDKFALYRIARYCDELVDNGSKYDSTKPLKVGNFYRVSTAGSTTWSSVGASSDAVGTIFQATATTISGTGVACGVEPRFRANVFLTKATDVYKVLKDFATIFLGILYWQDSKITAVQDAPQDPVYNFTKGNVIDGVFSYESSGSRTRTNQVVVTWNDPTINYEPVPVIVEDRESIVRTGRIISQNAVAFGATSESQAIRYGRWKLWTAQNQTEVISFKTSLAAHYVKPGDVINIQDADRFGIAYSGRASSATSNTLTFDRNVSFNSGSTYELSTLVTAPAALNASNENVTINSVTYAKGEKVDQGYVYNGSSYVLVNLDTEERASNAFVDSSGSELLLTIWKPYSYVESHQITNPGSTVSTVTLANSATFDTTPAKHNIWALKETSGGLNVAGSEKMYKILSIGEEEPNIFTISAVEYYIEKFTAIEQDYALGVIPGSIYSGAEPNTLPPPRNPRVVLATDASMPGEELILEWDRPLSGSESIVQYEVLHNIEGIDNPLKTDKTQIVLNNVPNGSVTFKIRAISRLRNLSSYVAISYGVYDPYGANIERVQYGIPKGGVTSSEVGLVGSSGSEAFTFLDSNFVLASNGDKEVLLTPDEDSQDVSDIDADENYYVFLDADTPTLKLMYYDTESLENMPFWRDVGTGNSASSTSWTSIGSILIGANDNTVFGSGFNTNVKLRDVLNLSGSTSPTTPVGEGAIVISIISDTELLIDKTFDTQIATTGYRATYRPDYAADAAIARVHKNSSNVFSSENFLTLDPTLNSTTRAIAFDLDIQNLTYNSTSSQTNVPSSINATINAVGYRDPEFKIVIPAGMSAAGTQDFASSTDSDPLVQTYQLDDDGAIAYNSGAPLTIVASVREKNDPTNTVKSSTIVLTKSKDGTDAENGRVVNLTMGDQTFEYNTEGISPSPSSTTVTATALNTSGTVYYEFLLNDTSVQNTTAGTYSYTPPASYADMPQKIEVRIREGSSSSTPLARDQITASGLRAGSDAVTLILSNEAHTLTTTNTGTVTYTGSGTDIEVWEGTTPVPYDGSSPYASPSFRVSISSDTGITANSSPQTISTYTRRYGDHSSMTATSASIVYNIIVKNTAGVERTFTKTQSFSKSVEGNTGSSINLVFTRKATAPTATGTGGVPTDGTSSPVTWTDNPPGGTDPLWAVKGQLNTTTNQWSWGTPYRVDGNAVAEVYFYSNATTGADPTFSAPTYDFTNNNYTAPTNWNKAPPSLTADGQKIYVIVVLYASTPGDTAATADTTSAAVIYAQRTDGSPGSPGSPGLRTVQGYLYYEKTTSGSPGTPGEATYSFSNGDINGGSGATEVLGLEDTSAVNKWTNEPRPQDPTSSNTHYTVRYFGEEASASASTVEVSYSNIVQYTNFTGVVTFTNGTFSDGPTAIDGSTDATSIDGGNIKTNSITANQIQVSNGSGGSAGIFMDYNSGNSRIDIRDSSALRVRIGYLPD